MFAVVGDVKQESCRPRTGIVGRSREDSASDRRQCDCRDQPAKWCAAAGRGDATPSSSFRTSRRRIRRSTTSRSPATSRGFFESSLVLYDRCLRIAISDDDRQTAYANLTAAYWAAAAAESDPGQAQPSPSRRAVCGDRGARPGRRPSGPARPASRLAHRSVLFAELGHHESALTDAQRARHAGRRAWVAPRAGGGHGRRGDRPVAFVARHDRADVDRRRQGAGRGSRCRRLPALADCGRGRRAVEHGTLRRRPRGAATRSSSICTPSCTARLPIAGRTFVPVSTGFVRRRPARPMH